jgi:lysophospholipase
MELFAIDGNPIPDGASVGVVFAADGLRLRYARWRPTARRSQGTVCILQGRGEAIEKYFETISDLRRRGFAVATFDWRGQGGSERRLRNPMKAHIDSFAEYDRDLEAFTQQVLLPYCLPPYYALAHSTGGLIALRAAREGRARFSRMVLSAPLADLGPTRPRAPFPARISAVVTALGFGELAAPGQARETMANIPFEGNKLTGDPVRFARNKRLALELPALFVEGPTYAWLYAAYRACAEAADPDFAPAIKVPTLIVIGTLDTVVSVIAVERLAAEMRTGGQVVIAGGLHELLQERDAIREQFLAAFDSFIPGS